MGFSDSMRAFADAKGAELDKVVRKTVFDLSANVLKLSPVDTGRFRANWQYGFGVQPEGTLEATDRSSGGQQTAARIAGQVTQGAGVHYLVNNLPYAEVIEYGYYPDPPEHGTYVPRGKSKYGITGPGWVQRSEGGFSRQAPYGVARISVEFAESKLREYAGSV